METGSAIARAAIFPAALRPALSSLVTAFDYAADCHVDRWQFTIEMADLLAKGATSVDIRWLVLRGFAEHAREITLSGESERTFRPLPVTSFPNDTCLVLSSEGARVLRTALHDGQPLPSCNGIQKNGHAANPVALRVRPDWDEGRRELRYQGTVVKRYRVPAPNQETILSFFQLSDWPDFVVEPLAHSGEHDPKQRLHETIKSLNRNHLRPLIKFHANGHGRQIHWTAIEAS